jgi:hypothetical protein
MQLTINIPDDIYNRFKNNGGNIETALLQAIELFNLRKKMAVQDPLHKWFQTPLSDREKRSDMSENYDKYI